MKAILTLKPVTDSKANVWHAGQILGMASKTADTFVAAGNGLDMAATNFATAAIPDNSAVAVKAPTGTDFSLAMLGINTAAEGGAAAAPITYTINSSVDAVDPLKWSFTASPKEPGTFKFGDGSPNVNATTGEASYTYASGGTYTVTFIPVDGNKAATKSITVEAPAAKPAPEEPTPTE